MVVDIERNLSDKLILTSFASEDREHIIFTSRYKGTLGACDSGDFSSMGFENQTEILLLIPNMDSSIGTTRVANTILIKSGA